MAAFFVKIESISVVGGARDGSDLALRLRSRVDPLGSDQHQLLAVPGFRPLPHVRRRTQPVSGQHGLN